MSTIPSNLARTSTAMTGDTMMSHLRRSHADLLRLQTELATGKRVNKPSDAPESITLIRTMQGILSQFEQDKKALSVAGNAAAMTDQALGEASQLVMQAKNIASSQIGLGSDAETREGEAAVVDSLIQTVMQLGNTKFQDVYLFGGQRASEQPFVERHGGIAYLGAGDALTQQIGGAEHALNASGAKALGALSSRVEGKADLALQATGQTRIGDLDGARGVGVTLGAVRVTVNGDTTEVDLRGAERLSDVTARINNALDGAGTLSLTGDGFALAADAGQQIAIADPASGATAADLGISLAADDGGAATGPAINPRLALTTPLADIGAAVDWESGLKITNGSERGVVDFSTAETVEDLINRVGRADLGVRLAINDAGRGFNLINAVSGTNMSVGENAGGATAATLGLRSFAGETHLDDLNHGNGVRRTADADDLRIDMGDGVSSFAVNIDGATTVQEAMEAILAAADDAGFGGELSVSLADDGNGIVLTSGLAGGDTFRVSSINGSRAADDLGIAGAVAGATLAGRDVAEVRTDSVLTHLIMLRDGLLDNDERKITEAGELLGQDTSGIVAARAQEGVRAQRIEAELERIEQRSIQTHTMLSDLQDSDYAEAVSRFTRLQQQLEATLVSGQQMMRLSLLDFLR